MNIDEARRRAGITTYTFDGGVEQRRDAFPMAKLRVAFHDLANEAFPRLTEKFRELSKTLTLTKDNT